MGRPAVLALVAGGLAVAALVAGGPPPALAQEEVAEAAGVAPPPEAAPGAPVPATRVDRGVVPGRGGAPVREERVVVEIPAGGAPNAEYTFSQRGGTLVSARMLEARYTREARPPMEGVPEAKLAAGPIDLVSTWSPSFLPFRILFNELAVPVEARLLVRRATGGAVRDGRLQPPGDAAALEVDKPVRPGDQLVVSAPAAVAGTFRVARVTASGSIELEEALPAAEADGVAYEVRRIGPVRTLWETDATFTRLSEPPGLPLTYVWPDPATDESPLWIEKRFEAGRHPHELALTVTLHNTSGEPVQVQPGLRVSGWQHPALASSGSMFTFPRGLYAASCLTGGDLERVEYAALVEEPQSLPTETTWVGVDTRYFLLAAAADNLQGAQCRLEAMAPPVGVISATMWASSVQTLKPGGEGCVPGWLAARAGRPSCDDVIRALGHAPGDSLDAIRATWQSKREELSGDARTDLDAAYNALRGRKRAVYRFTLFAGPKDTVLLDASGHGLSASLDFGSLAFISEPMLKLLRWLQGGTGHWAWAIIILTFLVKALLLPLTNKSFTQMQRMAKLRPQMEQIQKDFKDDREALGKAQLALFKREKVNPLGGCLPMVVQMPIWFALYRTILSSVELFNAPLALWVQDLSSPDPYYVMPVILGGLMLVQSYFTPTTPGADGAQQKFLKYGMPLMFSVFMVALPSGLVLYILVNTVLTIIQNIIIRRRLA